MVDTREIHTAPLLKRIAKLERAAINQQEIIDSYTNHIDNVEGERDRLLKAKEETR